jgi:hypothetical protein
MPAGEALRLFEASGISGTLLLAHKLLVWLQTSWCEPLVSLPDIYRLGPNAIRDKATAKGAAQSRWRPPSDVC